MSGRTVDVVLVSTYELGRQPFGLASPVAWLREAGFEVHPFDLSRQRLDWDLAGRAPLVAFYLPMHTATRLAGPVIRRVRATNSTAHVCAYGLYAPLNRAWLADLGVSSILGGEFEADLVALARAVVETREPGQAGVGDGARAARARLHEGRATARAEVPRLAFRVPDRSDLPPLDRYAALVRADGRRTVAGYTEASRGCRHVCRHCPIVPIYGGQFRIVPVDVVMADVRQQVEHGARHITFGDPDFFNGIGHARAVIRAFGREFPGVTYDVTIKVEHLVSCAPDLPCLVETGCLFVTSAVESVDDAILARLDKGHTRADVERAAAACRDVGLRLAPTFVPFTPWTTPEGYAELLDFIEEHELVGEVAPVQLAIRLLVTEGSRLLELEDVRRLVRRFDEATLAYPWSHSDPAVDALQREIEQFVAHDPSRGRSQAFAGIRALAERAFAGRAGEPRRRRPSPWPPGTVQGRVEIAWLDEPWYC